MLFCAEMTLDTCGYSVATARKFTAGYDGVAATAGGSGEKGSERNGGEDPKVHRDAVFRAGGVQGAGAPRTSIPRQVR